ncbi:HAMP domain-containing histidine kinase [Sphingobacterium sp. lm-10]|uniref:sensor histidine kinase n=1 Tax=Sphingobacterium sp. lm-10 TaxID=2944904 RepID=UPI002020490F|nr:HAMP domain-containing sensor histidine kinase [Sphingobacterium sp. lm-10]MCL7987810.1 HAMP domain-containing histidine kinase [Sphingobacterium sp. lm-10]
MDKMTFSRLWRALSHLGVDPQMTYMEIKRVHMVNLIAISCVPAMFFFSIVNFFEGRYFLSLINMANSLFCLSVLFLQHYKRQELAKIILLGVSFFFFYFGALFYGNAGENFLLCIMIVCMLLYDSRVVQWSVGILVIAGIVSIKLFPKEVLFTNHVPQSRVLINTISSLVFIVIAVHFFKNIIYNNMMLIEEQRQKLQLLNHDKERIFSIVAHDIRSPLSTLDGMVHLLHKQVIDGAVSEEYILQLQRQIAKQKEVLDDILSWSSRSMLGVPKPSVTTRVADVIETLVLVFKSACDMKGIELLVEIDKVFHVYVDRDHLIIILRNLLSNAVKFSHTNSVIKISVSHDLGYGFIHVTDSGIGMHKDQAEYLFHTIQQRSVGTDNEPGAGLGLLLCSELIKHNNGIVHVDSVLGSGSRFTVGFPILLDG